jgi:hypothetical protein
MLPPPSCPSNPQPILRTVHSLYDVSDLEDNRGVEILHESSAGYRATISKITQQHNAPCEHCLLRILWSTAMNGRKGSTSVTPKTTLQLVFELSSGEIVRDDFSGSSTA